MSRYRAGQAVVWTWHDPHNAVTCVAWRSATHWEAIKRSLTDALRHGGLRFDPLRRRWSVPARNCGALEAWLSATFEPAAIVWGAGPSRTGWHERNRAAG